MSRLLDQRRTDAAIAIVNDRVAVSTEKVRAIMYSDGANSAPPGMDNLDEPEKVQVLSRYLKRQSNRERQGVVGGDLNQALVDHPAVREMAFEEGQPGEMPDGATE